MDQTNSQIIEGFKKIEEAARIQAAKLMETADNYVGGAKNFDWLKADYLTVVADSAAAYAKALLASKKGRLFRLHRAYMNNLSPSGEEGWNSHDLGISSAAWGFRLLESGVPVWPEYMGSKDIPTIRGIYPLIEYQIYGDGGMIQSRYKGVGFGRYNDLPSLIAEWGKKHRD